MRRIRLFEEIKRMRFEKIYETWQGRRLTQRGRSGGGALGKLTDV